MKTGIELIAEERQRQIEQEGWTPEHDDEHRYGELALAGAAYACHDSERRQVDVFGNRYGQGFRIGWFLPSFALWPFSKDWFKPSDRIRNLQKAGALIAAEIDRLQRLEQPATPAATPTEGREGA